MGNISSLLKSGKRYIFVVDYANGKIIDLGHSIKLFEMKFVCILMGSDC